MSELGLSERIKRIIESNNGRVRFGQITGKIKNIRSNLVSEELAALIRAGEVIQEFTASGAEIFWSPDAWANHQSSAGEESSADTAVDAALVPEALEPDPAVSEFSETLSQLDTAMNAVLLGFAEKAGDLWAKQLHKLEAMGISNRQAKIRVVTECSEFTLFPEHVRQLLAELAVELEKFPDAPNLGG